jgi:hypothetical protein
VPPSLFCSSSAAASFKVHLQENRRRDRPANQQRRRAAAAAALYAPTPLSSPLLSESPAGPRNVGLASCPPFDKRTKVRDFVARRANLRQGDPAPEADVSGRYVPPNPGASRSRPRPPSGSVSRPRCLPVENNSPDGSGATPRLRGAGCASRAAAEDSRVLEWALPDAIELRMQHAWTCLSSGSGARRLSSRFASRRDHVGRSLLNQVLVQRGGAHGGAEGAAVPSVRALPPTYLFRSLLPPPPDPDFRGAVPNASGVQWRHRKDGRLAFPCLPDRAPSMRRPSQ